MGHWSILSSLQRGHVKAAGKGAVITADTGTASTTCLITTVAMSYL
jgi:hypothetical protein